MIRGRWQGMLATGTLIGLLVCSPSAYAGPISNEHEHATNQDESWGRRGMNSGPGNWSDHATTVGDPVGWPSTDGWQVHDYSWQNGSNSGPGGSVGSSDRVFQVVVPEPASAAVLSAGFLGIGLVRRRSVRGRSGD